MAILAAIYGLGRAIDGDYCALTNRCDEQGIGAAHAAIDLDRRLGQLDHLAVPLIVLGAREALRGDAGLLEGLGQRRFAERGASPKRSSHCRDPESPGSRQRSRNSAVWRG